MAAWRILGSGALTLLMVHVAGAQTYPLAETIKVDQCFHYQIQMNLTGQIRVSKGGKPVTLKLAATATQEFPERDLAVNPNGLPVKVARIYEAARAVITLDGDASERTLRTDRSLVVIQRPKDQTLVYCPKGQFTREELELTSEHFDTLALTGLLPGKAVAIGDTWKPSKEVVQALCNFEGLLDQNQNLVCKLEEVKDNVARVSVTGTANGIDLGALTKLKIDATYAFDLAAQRLTALEWKQQDERDQGPASPATTTQSTTTLKRAEIPLPSILSPVALVSVPDAWDVPPGMTQLGYHDPKSRFDLIYGREWQVVAQTGERLVLRLLDNGELIAQATITPWTKAPAGQHITPEAFQEAMAGTPGWEQGDVLQTGEVPSLGSGRWTYRISALGRMDGMPLLQNFYVVAGPGGDQVLLAFTLTQAQAEKLGTRDLTLVGSIDFPPTPK